MTAPTSIPLLAEQLEIDKRLVDTARVHIRKRARWREHEVDVALRRDEVDIERVAVNRLVDEAVASRQEGDVTIVPIYEPKNSSYPGAESVGGGVGRPIWPTMRWQM